LLSYEDYSAIEETAYLLRSPKNAQRLRESITSFKEGKGLERELIEVDE
jgi:antitoxin YefM